MFGYSVAMSATGTLVIGAPGKDTNTGAVYTTDLYGGTGHELRHTFTHSAKFGTAVAVDADGLTIAVGAPDYNDGFVNRGVTCVYYKRYSSWPMQDILIARDVSQPGKQGKALAINAIGNTILSGDPNDNSGSGSAWLFTRINGNWTQRTSELTTTGEYNRFGASVALSASGHIMMIGAPGSPSVAVPYT